MKEMIKQTKAKKKRIFVKNEIAIAMPPKATILKIMATAKNNIAQSSSIVFSVR